MSKFGWIEFFWKETGKLRIKVKGNNSMTLRFTPSEDAIKEGLAMIEGRRKEPSKDKDNT